MNFHPGTLSGAWQTHELKTSRGFEYILTELNWMARTLSAAQQDRCSKIQSWRQELEKGKRGEIGDSLIRGYAL